jgi:hypothetical protein
MTVRIHDVTAYEPDALVYCGAKLASTATRPPISAASVQARQTFRAVFFGHDAPSPRT